ncbi:MAG: hypothetical protein EXR86_02260 [Gammaproteobacteria bacterium]|nr:hypothetical protein [Gammaproteobacteria bacterium]
MKIDFDEADAGFFEARALHMVVRTALDAEAPLEARPLLDFMQDSARIHLARPEFNELREKHGMGGARWPSFSMFNHLWRRLVGPSQRETSLSQQRGEALERAERAEHSAFEALAESTRSARERDQASAEVVRLQQELARLKP